VLLPGSRNDPPRSTYTFSSRRITPLNPWYGPYFVLHHSAGVAEHVERAVRTRAVGERANYKRVRKAGSLEFLQQAIEFTEI